MTGKLEVNNLSHNETLAEDEFNRSNHPPLFDYNDSFVYDKDVHFAEYMKEREAQIR